MTDFDQLQSLLRSWFAVTVPALLALFMLSRHIQRRVNSLTILGDRLRYEAGMISKTTRTMELAKVQDVRVDQTGKKNALRKLDHFRASLTLTKSLK